MRRDILQRSELAPVHYLPPPETTCRQSEGYGLSAGAYALSPLLSHVLAEVQHELSAHSASPDAEMVVTTRELEELLQRTSERLGVELSSYERDAVLSVIEKESRPFGILQELVDDPAISDIVVSEHSKIAVQQGRRNFSTGLSFANQESYENFVERLLYRAGATYSTKKPVADGMVGSEVRIHAVHKSICDSGPYLTIRINRFKSITTAQLVQYALAPKEIFDYLDAVVKAGKTLLIVGEVGTGKTTLTRALASCIPSSEAILVIEDTPEIRLEHPHVRYVTTREANTDGAGKISPSECIRAGMRMAMNRIIFGEMRDAEAAEAFIDVCSSGHPGMSTIHARSASEAISRMELFLGRVQKGASRQVLTDQISTAVQVIVYIDFCRITRRRRILEVREICGAADGKARQREMFRYSSQEGIPEWKVVNKITSLANAMSTSGVEFDMSSWPRNLSLSEEILYREAASVKESRSQ